VASQHFNTPTLKPILKAVKHFNDKTEQGLIHRHKVQST